MNARNLVKKFISAYLPWIITAIALYLTFRGVDFATLISNLKNASKSWLLVAVCATFASYLLRALRWEYFFLKSTMHFLDAWRVLILGFFMNNILPARAGELVRAHTGAKVSGETRTLVLATIASERLADGLTISLMFLLFATSVGDQELSHELFLVSLAFGFAAFCIILVLFMRRHIFKIAEKLHLKFDNRGSNYAFDRLQIFLNGLTPLLTPSRLPASAGLSIIIWCVELSVYYCVAQAYQSELSLPLCVLFMVAVNFSSLIPAAPGGIGVIELIASAALVSVGIDREHALTMVITQHLIQYLTVGIPGLVILLGWKGSTNNQDAITNSAT